MIKDSIKNPMCLNRCYQESGSIRFNGPHSEETKRKMSKSHTGLKISAEAAKKIGNAHKGKESQLKGRKRPKEVCDKIGNGHRGKLVSLLTRKKISDAIKSISDETRRKQSEAKKRWWANKLNT